MELIWLVCDWVVLNERNHQLFRNLTKLLAQLLDKVKLYYYYLSSFKLLYAVVEPVCLFGYWLIMLALLFPTWYFCKLLYSISVHLVLRRLLDWFYYIFYFCLFNFFFEISSLKNLRFNKNWRFQFWNLEDEINKTIIYAILKCFWV
jgi:hypothetical protein